MDVLIISIAAMVCYLAAGLVALQSHRIGSSKAWILGIGFVAICLHGLLLHAWIDIAAGQNLNFFNMLSLTTWLISIMIWVVVFIKPVDLLAVFVFPVSALSILLVILFPAQFIVKTAADPDTLFHILLAIVTFCVLCVAGLLAVLLAFQERLLRYKPQGVFIQRLPPLESMETLLFQVVSLGFVLLSVVLVTSLYFYHDILFAHIAIIQKSVMVLAAWIIFAVLLIGRYRWGWRGRKAIYGTLGGLLLLVIAYFGSKLVLNTTVSLKNTEPHSSVSVLPKNRVLNQR